MMNALKSEPDRDFPIPGHIRFETVDTKTGCNPKGGGKSLEVLTVPLMPDQLLCVEGEQ